MSNPLGHSPEITSVVLTGGPCSGKTTAMAALRQTFEDRGVNVLFVPEAATHLFSTMGAKVSPEHLSLEDLQSPLISLQINQENLAYDIARKYKNKTLILLDRGLLDGKAYVGKEVIQAALKKHELTEQEVLSGRYDGIIHMVTAAEGAEEFYTCENNTARTETPEQARALDERLRQSYNGANRLHIIDNSTSFKDKLRRVEEAISHILGIPQPIEIENKYFVRIKNWDTLFQISRKIHIEQSYLEIGEKEERIRARTVDGVGSIYSHTLKQPYGKSRIKTERIILPEEYEQLSNRSIGTVEKTRYCFLYKNQYFELDVFSRSSRKFEKNEALLEIELMHEGQDVILPEFLEEVENVTGNWDFYNQNLMRLTV